MIILNDGRELAIINYVCDNDNDITDEFLGLSDLECYGDGMYMVDSVCWYVLDIEEWLEQDMDNHSAEWVVHTLA